MSNEQKDALYHLWTSLAGIQIVLNRPQFDAEKLYEAIECLDKAFNTAKSLDTVRGPISKVISMVEDFRIDLHHVYSTKMELTYLMDAIWEILDYKVY